MLHAWQPFRLLRRVCGVPLYDCARTALVVVAYLCTDRICAIRAGIQSQNSTFPGPLQIFFNLADGDATC